MLINSKDVKKMLEEILRELAPYRTKITEMGNSL